MLNIKKTESLMDVGFSAQYYRKAGYGDAYLSSQHLAIETGR